MDPALRLKYSPSLSYNNNNMNIRQAFGSQTSLNGGKAADVPFYINAKSGKTSAEIIEEAKATITKGDQGEQNGGRAMSVKTIDTKRPFTPRQTDRRLYYGSTNHVARPPSSFRLRPLPEEEMAATGGGRPVTAGVKLSPLSARLLGSEMGGEERLPTLLPQLPKSAQLTSRRSPKAEFSQIINPLMQHHVRQSVCVFVRSLTAEFHELKF